MELDLMSRIEQFEKILNKRVVLIKAKIGSDLVPDQDVQTIFFANIKKIITEMNSSDSEAIIIVSGFWPFSSHFLDGLVEFRKRINFQTIGFSHVGGGMSLFYLCGSKRERADGSIVSTVGINQILQDFNLTVLHNMKSFVPEVSDQQNVPVREILKNYSAEHLLDPRLIDQVNTSRIYKNFNESIGKKVSLLLDPSISYKSIIDENGNTPYLKEPEEHKLAPEIEKELRIITDLIDEMELGELAKSKEFRKQWIKIYSSQYCLSLALDIRGILKEINKI